MSWVCSADLPHEDAIPSSQVIFLKQFSKPLMNSVFVKDEFLLKQVVC